MSIFHNLVGFHTGFDMEEKFSAALCLLPANCEAMNCEINLALSSNHNISDAVIHRLRQSCSYFYEKQFLKSLHIADEV